MASLKILKKIPTLFLQNIALVAYRVDTDSPPTLLQDWQSYNISLGRRLIMSKSESNARNKTKRKIRIDQNIAEF